MGENEQGGMLRTVVVVGLIVIISMALIFSISKLKTNLWKNTEAGVPPTAVIAALQPDQLTLSKTIYGESKNFVPNSPLEPNTVKTDDNMDVSIDTTHMKGRGWALVDSPHYALSDSVKRVKYEVELKGGGENTAHPSVYFYDANGNLMQDGLYFMETPEIGSGKTLTNFKTYTKTFTVPDGAKSFTVSLHAAENMQVTYRNATATLFTW